MRRNYRNHVKRTAEKCIDGKGHSGRRQERRRKRGKITQGLLKEGKSPA